MLMNTLHIFCAHPIAPVMPGFQAVCISKNIKLTPVSTEEPIVLVYKNEAGLLQPVLLPHKTNDNGIFIELVHPEAYGYSSQTLLANAKEAYTALTSTPGPYQLYRLCEAHKTVCAKVTTFKDIIEHLTARRAAQANEQEINDLLGKAALLAKEANPLIVVMLREMIQRQIKNPESVKTPILNAVEFPTN